MGDLVLFRDRVADMPMADLPMVDEAARAHLSSRDCPSLGGQKPVVVQLAGDPASVHGLTWGSLAVISGLGPRCLVMARPRHAPS